MKPIVVECHIEAPVERVFGYLSDLPKLPSFNPSISRIEMLTEGAIGTGTRWRETRKAGGKESVLELKMTDYRPPYGYTVVTETMGNRFTTYVECYSVETGSGTSAKMTLEIKSISFSGDLTALFAAGPFRKNLREDLDALKRVCERS